MSQRKTLTIFLLVGLLTLVMLVGVTVYLNVNSDSTTTTSSSKSVVWIPIWLAAMIPIITARKRRKDKRKNNEVEYFDE